MSLQSHLFTVLLFAFTAAACSSPADEPKPDAPASTGGTAVPPPAMTAADPHAAPPGEGAALPPPVEPTPVATFCDGTQTGGILGTWNGTELIAGESMSGRVPLQSTYRFCGSQTGGTFRLTGDAHDSPHAGCHQVGDLRGQFTVSGTTLMLTFGSGSADTTDCPMAADNVSHTVSKPWSRSYTMNLAAKTLTLLEVGLPADTAVTYEKP